MKNQININREPISSEEIETFKDFKSILRKHAQATEDIAKIKSVKSSKWYWAAGGVVGAVLIGSVLFTLGGNSTSEKKSVSISVENKKMAKIPVTWQVKLNTDQEDLATFIGAISFDIDRVEFANLSDAQDVQSLLPNLLQSDLEYALGKNLLRLEQKSQVELSANKTLLKLSKGQWQKVQHIPHEIPQLRKPKKMEQGRIAVKVNFDPEAFPELAKFDNVYWQPVNAADVMDEDVYDMKWEGATIKKANVEGLYDVVFYHNGEGRTFHFLGYPVFTGLEFEKAMSDYNAALSGEQEKMKKMPKRYDVGPGVYIVQD